MLDENNATKKIKICHIISGDVWAGAEASAFLTIKGLFEDYSCDVSVIVFNEGILADKLRKHGVPVTVIEETGRKKIGILYRLIIRLYQDRPDIVHAHGIKENFIGGMAAIFCRVKALVRTHHGMGYIGKDAIKTIIEWLNDKVITDLNIPVSYDLKEYLKVHGIRNAGTRVIHNSIDINDIKPPRYPARLKRELNIEDGDFIISSIGRLVPVKGLEHFVNAADIVLNTYKDHKDLVFLIVGDGPLTKQLDDQIRERGRQTEIRTIGFRKDVINILSITDIFVMTSLHEGVPMVLLEAMCMKKPVIATKVGGIPEIITHGQNGLLIPPGDAVALSSAIDEIIRDDALRERLAMGAFNYVNECLDIKSGIKKLKKYYMECIR